MNQVELHVGGSFQIGYDRALIQCQLKTGSGIIEVLYYCHPGLRVGFYPEGEGKRFLAEGIQIDLSLSAERGRSSDRPLGIGHVAANYFSVGIKARGVR